MASLNYFLQPLAISPIIIDELVEINAQLLPWHLRGLELQKGRSYWKSRDDWIAGVKSLSHEQERLLMGIGEKLQMEIRAMRGVDDLQPGYNDPTADPFTLSLGTIENNKRELEAVNAKLEAIRLLVADLQNAQTLEDIAASAAKIAVLLG